MITTGELLTAEEQVLKAVAESFAESEDDLAGPIKKLLAHVQDEILQNEKCCTRLKTKFTKFLNKAQAECGNDLSACLSHLASNLYLGIEDDDAILTQLAVKGGLLQVGQDLGTLDEEIEKVEDKLEYGGTLVLAIKEAIPFFNELIQVLREIRDRIPGMPFVAPGETEPESEGDYLKSDEYVEMPSTTQEIWDIDGEGEEE